ncbi:uncharacterized protein LOC118184088 [Stegodyphus dumicola]|uniref:uncharacterized protein LOC118184088 n=1 Tax=Stegodyphus dumicola TaxID=202533 RepID=UPI0015B34742|nr:uncharacterized protein LOC118184088 [Stegodyphus dumicola]
MVLLVSFALFLLPSLFPSSLQSKVLMPGKNGVPPVAGRSRVLLSSKDNVDSSPLTRKMSDENVSSNYKEYAPQMKADYFQESYPDMLKVFDDVPPIKVGKYGDIPEYGLHNPGLNADTSGSALQNESRFVEIGGAPDSNKNVVLKLK